MRRFELLLAVVIASAMATAPVQPAFALTASEKGTIWTQCYKSQKYNPKTCCSMAGATWNDDGYCEFKDDRRNPGQSGIVAPRKLTIAPTR
jgi:hypothetical protein